MDIYNQLRKADKQISLGEAIEILLLTCPAFDLVYICVDALDELEERERIALLKSLQGTPRSVYLFTTGRNHVKTNVKSYFNEVEMVQIKAMEIDVTHLIKYEIMENSKAHPKRMDETLEREIKERIVSLSTGKLATPF